MNLDMKQTTLKYLSMTFLLFQNSFILYDYIKFNFGFNECKIGRSQYSKGMQENKN